MVAIIDSGACLSKVRNRKVIDGIGIQVVEEKARISKRFQNCNNLHGTYCVNVIQTFFPGSSLHCIRIIETDGKMPLMALIESINYCIKKNIQIINLSLGVFLPFSCDALCSSLISALYNGHIIIVAGSAKSALPAHLPGVITVVDEGYHDSSDLTQLSKVKYDVTVTGDYCFLGPGNQMGVFRQSTSLAAPYISALIMHHVIEKDCYNYITALDLLNKAYNRTIDVKTIASVIFSKLGNGPMGIA